MKILLQILTTHYLYGMFFTLNVILRSMCNKANTQNIIIIPLLYYKPSFYNCTLGDQVCNLLQVSEITQNLGFEQQPVQAMACKCAFHMYPTVYCCSLIYHVLIMCVPLLPQKQALPIIVACITIFNFMCSVTVHSSSIRQCS